MRLIKMSYFCCHPKKYLLDWATSYFCSLMPNCNVNNMYAVVTDSYLEFYENSFRLLPL